MKSKTDLYKSLISYRVETSAPAFNFAVLKLTVNSFGDRKHSHSNTN